MMKQFNEANDVTVGDLYFELSENRGCAWIGNLDSQIGLSIADARALRDWLDKVLP